MLCGHRRCLDKIRAYRCQQKEKEIKKEIKCYVKMNMQAPTTQINFPRLLVTS
jgi:hypothetical protein